MKRYIWVEIAGGTLFDVKTEKDAIQEPPMLVPFVVQIDVQRYTSEKDAPTKKASD
ncbi:MAG: hypothetical protein Phog2KO_50870 [Phototrophicaceae bacterium]